MRIGLSGQGDPIPTDPFSTDDDGDALSFYLNDGDSWEPGPLIADGRTQFQVWCVGASGGYGGPIDGGVVWAQSLATDTMDTDMWDNHVHLFEYYYNHLGLSPVKSIPGNSSATLRQWLQYHNPTHSFNRKTWWRSYLKAYLNRGPGAPGGGGLQVVTGDLIDLPESVAVVVGSAGADAPVGQTEVNGLWTPVLGVIDLTTWTDSPFDAQGEHALVEGWPNSSYPLALAAYNELKDWGNIFPETVSFPVPEVGEDGGPSSFGDICSASGGKGGAPAEVWSGSAFVVDSSGGDGGVGDSVVAGGGGAGSESTTENGADGTFASEIGQGGGGGHSSNFHDGTDGGKGSYSSSALGIFGERGVKDYLAVPYPNAFDPDTGEPTHYLSPRSTKKIWPGAGGGVRVHGDGKYGSRAEGYDPDGAVFIRVI